MNTKIWNLYKSSEEGKKVINLFSWWMMDDCHKLRKLITYVNEHWNKDLFMDDVTIGYEDILASFTIRKFDILSGDISREKFANFIDEYELRIPIVEDDGNINLSQHDKDYYLKKDAYRNKSADILFLSLFLYFNEEHGTDNVGFFKPMLLHSRHDLFQRNCEALGIELPFIPRTYNHREYCLYYYDICLAINDFQKKYQLADAETCACIYDFAPMLIEEKITIADLPKPVNVWLTGADPGDFKTLDGLGKKDNSGNPNFMWACNERTCRGDIVVIYCLRPRSCFHSIWRAKIRGIFNPFDYYHCRTNLCDGIKIPDISLKELKEDEYFSKHPLVRRNLQGINGVELSAKDYAEFLRIIEKKGGDLSVLPKLYEGSAVNFGVVNVEKDVEEKILIPFLRKLGYKENDWTRQLSLKAGRNTKAIPDFVFFAQGEKHFENAPMVIEAKYDMSSTIELQKAYAQSLSYARMLQAKLFGICDKERLIIYKIDNSGAGSINSPVYENHWGSIYADDVEGAKLKQIMGYEIVKQLQY
ncbi:MAG: type I restriction enzyme HsdR N-terminal domain-containing protein [Bacteroidales bacterium]|nr:type I restriction enzyme HsdR N-terminal domain-containing protein [Bacteroidales bacterium]